MKTSSLALRTTTFTSGSTACIEWRASSTAGFVVKQIEIAQATATACTYGLGRPQAIGVTPTSPVLFQSYDGLSTSPIYGAIAWGTSPTVPLAYLRAWNSAASVGEKVIWTFDDGLVVLPTKSLVIWNVTTTVACDINCIIYEAAN